MILPTLLSVCSLFTSPIAAINPSIEIIYECHLDTAEGRLAFLTNELVPYVTHANELNQEIEALAQEINALSPAEDPEKLSSLLVTLTQKMNLLNEMLPILQLTLSIDEDLQKIDALLCQTGPLSPEDRERLDRITSLCQAVKNER